MTAPNLAEAYANAGKALLDLADALTASQDGPGAAPEPKALWNDGTPVEDDWTETDDWTDTPQSRSATGGCPIHGVPWVVKPAGTSKATGKPYNAFWHCNEKDGSSYCREKPSLAWVKAHPIR